MQNTIPGGIYPRIATPFAADGAVSAEGLRTNLARWAAANLTGLVDVYSSGSWLTCASCKGASGSDRSRRETTYTNSLFRRWLTWPTFSPCGL